MQGLIVHPFPDAFFDEELPRTKGVWMIDLKHGNGRPPYGRQADQYGTVESEVSRPTVSPGMKKPLDASGSRVHSRQIRSFVAVAEMTGQGQVIRIVRTGMAFGLDVFDVKYGEGGKVFGQTTILAATASSVANKTSHADFHEAERAVFK